MTTLSDAASRAARKIRKKLVSDGSIYEDGADEYQLRIASIIEAELSAEPSQAVAWMNPSDHDTGFTREKPDDMNGWFPLWTLPQPARLNELAEQWLKEANEQPGELPFQVMGVQMRICADQLKKILKSPLFRPFDSAPPAHPQPPAIDAMGAAREICDYYQVAPPTIPSGLDNIAAIISRHTGKEGWVLAPREPTEAMLKACHHERGALSEETHAKLMTALDTIRVEDWKAMLSAIEEKR